MTTKPDPTKVSAVLLPDGWHTVTWRDGTSTFDTGAALTLPTGHLFQDADNGGALTEVLPTAVLALRYTPIAMDDPDIAKLIDYIDAAGEEGVSRTMIGGHLFRRNLPADRLGELLQALEGTGQYETVKVETAGRPKTVIRRTGGQS